MIGDTTIYLILAASSFGLMLILSIGARLIFGHIKANTSPFSDTKGKVFLVIFLLLFALLGFSIIPITVKWLTDSLPLVITTHSLPLTLQENAMNIVYGAWILYAIGILIAIPAMIKDKFFIMETG